MTANDVYKIVIHFIDNDFAHFKNKTEKRLAWILRTLVGLLISIILLLLALLLGK